MTHDATALTIAVAPSHHRIRTREKERERGEGGEREGGRNLSLNLASQCRKGETLGCGRTIFKGDSLAYLRHRSLSTQMNQVPGAPSLRSFAFFSARYLFLPLSFSLLPSRLLSSSLARRFFLFFLRRPACRSAFAIRTRYFVAPRFRVHSCPRAPIRRTCVYRGARFAPRRGFASPPESS